MSMMERMRRGELYLADDPELLAAQGRAQDLLARFNTSSHEEEALRAGLMQQLLGAVGEGVVIKPTFRCDYGFPISIGAGTFINYDCIILDVVDVHIGVACQLATRVQLLTATHPVDPVTRRVGWESGAPISIGDNVWLGGGVVVLPGVAIGDDTVVGAGSIVTKDLPAGVVAVGSPARPLRAIGEADRVTPPDR
ncbi:MAG: sugar O-acetyltransferase [Nitriliruptoraceae bacterium]